MTDAYKSWNDKLAAYFFNENMAGREVLLYASFDLIEEVGSDLGGIEGFITAVKTGPSWIRNGDLCAKADKLFQTWKFDRSGNYPPYIAYLVSFVLANYIEGDFDVNAYYPRLKTLLRLEHESNASRCFDKMYVLWDDLEKWSKEDREEELGSFTARVRGGKWHVGLPLSQTLLSKEERDYLSLIFREASFEPGASPAGSTIVGALRKFGAKYLSKRTLRLLDSKQDKDLTVALVDFVREELITWDGSLQINLDDTAVVPDENVGYIRSTVKICLRIEAMSKKVTAILRIKSNRDFPIDGLNLANGNPLQQGSSFDCKRATQFWTTPLKRINQQVSSFELDWTNSLLLRDDERRWEAAMNGTSMKWFIPGIQEQLPDMWVESSQVLEKNAAFAIVCHPDLLTSIAEWIETQCEPLKPQMLLPNGWLLFQAKNARKPCPGMYDQNNTTQPILRLRGGVRLGNRNAFINYCPPKAFVENAPDNVDVVVSGNGLTSLVKLRKEEGVNSWTFPDGLPIGQSLKVHVLEQGEEIKVNGNRVITFDDGNLLPPYGTSNSNRVGRDSSGKFMLVTDLALPAINGTKFHNYHPIDLVPEQFPLSAAGANVILLGQRAGEIAELDPNSQINFQPVWALVKRERKRWLIQFCANNLDAVSPLPPLKNTISRQVKEWKRFVWVNRMVNDASQLELAALKKLWEAYKNVAARL